MEQATRQAFNAYLDQQAALNGADPEAIRDGKKFTVEPSVQQKLNDKQQESSAFLKAINVAPVDELKGDKLGLGIAGPIASRTNTATTDRSPIDPSTIDSDGYECKKTDSDTFITYAKLDMWAKFADFQTRIRNQIVQRQALDRIMVGFNGTSAAAATNRATYPLGQDVNIGWLAKYRANNAGARVLSSGKVANKVRIGTGANIDYANINALVKDATHGLMPSWARNDTALVAILGEDLEHDTFFPLINSDLVPTETNAADLIISAKRVGGKRAVTVPFFPPNAMLITRLDNLSIYEQSGKRRRTVVDNAKRDRIETYESSNDAYVVEDYDYGCLIENIEFVAA